MITEKIKKLFKKTAFNGEFVPTTGVIKWNNPGQKIIYKITGNYSSVEAQFVRETMSRLSTITGIHFIDEHSLSGETEEFDMKIIFSTSEEYLDQNIYFNRVFNNLLNRTINGFHTIYQNPDKSIKYSEVWIRSDSESDTRGVILEELVQSLGLTGDITTDPHSVFYQNKKIGQFNDITVDDLAIIEMLYNDSVRAGMTYDEVIQVLEFNSVKQENAKEIIKNKQEEYSFYHKNTAWIIAGIGVLIFTVIKIRNRKK